MVSTGSIGRGTAAEGRQTASSGRLGRAGAVPADALLHPGALLAIAVLVVNDHVLKSAWPGLVTGKLSDVAGLVFFPLVLLGGYESLAAVARRWPGPRARPLLVSVALTGIAFALVKTAAPAADAFARVLAVGEWAIVAAVHPLTGGDVPTVVVGRVLADPTDLVALPALIVPLWIGRRRLGPPSAGDPSAGD